jgi:hypothetical protein
MCLSNATCTATARPHAGAPPELNAHLLTRTASDDDSLFLSTAAGNEGVDVDVNYFAHEDDDDEEGEENHEDIVPTVDPATPASAILGPKSHVSVTLALLAAQFVLACVTPVGSFTPGGCQIGYMEHTGRHQPWCHQPF